MKSSRDKLPKSRVLSEAQQRHELAWAEQEIKKAIKAAEPPVTRDGGPAATHIVPHIVVKDG
jgi:hypothetical protein